MDRGFTVEGLTVSYMPRGLGIGNADTVQTAWSIFWVQAIIHGIMSCFRWSKCASCFSGFVEHEEDVRGELERFSHTRRPLSDWRRESSLADSFVQPETT